MDTLRRAATSSTAIEEFESSALATVISLSFKVQGLPPIRPRALAAFRLALVRSRIIARSISASAPKI